MLIAEDVAWQIRNGYEGFNVAMAWLFRRKTRLLTLLTAVLVFYLLVIFIPKSSDNSLYGFAYVHSSYNWANHPQAHPVPVSDIHPLPTGKPRAFPSVQYAFKRDTSKEGLAREQVIAERQAQVKAAFVKTWAGYRKYAWMDDELRPVSGGYKNNYGGWAATLIDSLDTLWIMGLKDDFYEAAAAAVTIDWAVTDETSCNFFETTIRYLGGLLSAFDLSKETALLEKAIELGDMLYMNFDTPNRMPGFWFDFELAKRGQQVAGTHDSSAAVCSEGLEFTRLAQLTGEDKYYDAIDRVANVLDDWQNNTKLSGMWPTFFDMQDLSLNGEASFTLGALADSLYEYLPKMLAITGGLDAKYDKMYRDAMETAIENVLYRPMTPDQPDILFAGDVYVSSAGPHLTPRSQHLTCFAGGMFGLGGKLLNIPEHVDIGERLARGCGWAYDSMPTGIMPEIFEMMSCDTLEACSWDQSLWDYEGAKYLPKGYTGASDPRYLLRPEAIESVFLLYRMTGKQEFQEMAWRMFQSIVAATETDIAYSSIDIVTKKGPSKKSDSMESFWTGETLKYFYLIFSDPDVISLDKYVFNTEAHPFLRPSATSRAEHYKTRGQQQGRKGTLLDTPSKAKDY